MDTGLYEVIYDPELKAVRMELPPYFRELPAREGVAKLKEHIRELNEELRRHRQAFMGDDVEVPTSLEKMRRLILELELCQQSIPYFQECRHFSPRPLKMVNRLHSAA